jgi:WD40 repeat protein
MLSPFKFLDAYTKEDKDIFFGRDAEVEELYQKVMGNKLLVICGVSGTGKTSLINCGLANKFEETDWLPINIRRGRDISESLRKGLSVMAITPLKEDMSVINILQSLYLDHFKPIWLIFDQFEEVFIFGTREERQEFIKEVKKIIDSDIQCRLIFVLREEYLAGTIEFEKEIPTFLANRIRIEKMTWHNAIKVIEEPCKFSGIEIEEGLAEKMLGRLSPESTEVELTFLQVLLDRMYRLAVSRDKQNPHFTKELLEEAGDVSDLLGSFLEEQIVQLEDPDTGLTILKSFVSVKGTKRQVTIEEINDFAATLGKKVQENDLKNLIQKFVNLRILREKDTNGRYELRHDSLASKIYEKITLVEKEIIEVRQFIENAYENYQRRGILLAQDDLDYINIFKGRLFLDKDHEDFIQKSNTSLKARIRTLRRVTGLSVLVLVLVLSLMGYYYYKKQDKSRAIDYAVQALLQKDTSPELSFKSAYQAYLINPNNTLAQKAVFDAYYSLLESKPSHELISFEPGSSEIINISFSEDDNLITGFLADSSVCVWNINGEKLLSLDFPNSVLEVKLSPNNQYLGVLCTDRNVYVYDINGKKILERKVKYPVLHPEDVFQLSSDGSYVIHLDPSNEIIITELASGKIIQSISELEPSVNDIALSDDQEWLAAGLSDGTIRLWRRNNNMKYRSFRIIKAHTGIVWSVDFPGNSKFILSASADSSYAIWDFNGQKVYGSFDWGYPVQKELPYCKAIFRGKDKVIILTAYEFQNDSAVNNYTSYLQIDYSGNSQGDGFGYNFYNGPAEADFYDGLKNDRIDKRLKYYDYSPNGFYYALSYTNEGTFNIYFADGLNLKTLQGINPVFSYDGKYIVCIENNKIHLHPGEVSEIIHLVMEEKIFGTINIEQPD